MYDGDDHHQESKVVSLDLKNLKVISVLGRGAKGVVFLVQTENGELLALKTILRTSIEKNEIDKDKGNEYRRLSFEQQFLSCFQHPLLPKLYGVVSTEMIVGYAIDYCSGGNLHTLRKKQTEKMFSDDIIRFYAAEMVLALEYLHGLGIVYRDLKPENVMIQENGHLMLVDFDLSTKLSPKIPTIHSTNEPDRKLIPQNKKKPYLFYKCCNSGISPEESVHLGEFGGQSVDSELVEKCNSFVGTEDYMAPEIVIGKGHDFAVDWWCLGVMLYEMLYGKTPFRSENRKETFNKILNKEPELSGEATPLRDLVRKLLEKNSNQRITVDEIKRHEFFENVDWDFILEIPRTPFISSHPEVEDMEGNKEINVEKFVQGVFKDIVGDEKRVEREKVIDDEEFKNKEVWVQGLNYATQEMTIF